jgi:hypothetical protein
MGLGTSKEELYPTSGWVVCGLIDGFEGLGFQAKASVARE